MSKRAEELALQIDCMVNRIDIDLDIPKAAALIDAELRKERERCAERAIALNRGPDPRGDMDMWAKEDAKLRAAILL